MPLIKLPFLSLLLVHLFGLIRCLLKYMLASNCYAFRSFRLMDFWFLNWLVYLYFSLSILSFLLAVAISRRQRDTYFPLLVACNANEFVSRKQALLRSPLLFCWFSAFCQSQPCCCLASSSVYSSSTFC